MHNAGGACPCRHGNTLHAPQQQLAVLAGGGDGRQLAWLTVQHASQLAVLLVAGAVAQACNNGGKGICKRGLAVQRVHARIVNARAVRRRHARLRLTAVCMAHRHRRACPRHASRRHLRPPSPKRGHNARLAAHHKLCQRHGGGGGGGGGVACPRTAAAISGDGGGGGGASSSATGGNASGGSSSWGSGGWVRAHGVEVGRQRQAHGTHGTRGGWPRGGSSGGSIAATRDRRHAHW